MANTETAPGVAGVYERELSYVWHTLARLGVPDADREDVAHDVFVIVHRKLAEYDAARPIRPWLFGIAYRVVSDWRRRAHRRREVAGDVDDVIATGRTPEQHVAARDDRALVLAALDRIELTRRSVFILHELDGCSIPEIAAALDAPVNTMYSHLRRARKDFARAVRTLRATGEWKETR